MSGRIAAAAFSVLGCSALHAANYFPLQNGNAWTYRVAGTRQEFAVRVGSPVTIAGLRWYPLTGYTSQGLLVRYEDDRLVYLDEPSSREAVLTSFLSGAPWPAPQRQCHQTGESVSKGGALEVRYTIQDCADAGVLTEEYADNVGMTRRTEETFAGPRTWELASAHLVSAAGPPSAGRFSVAVDRVTSESIAVSLAVRVEGAAPLHLEFSSGQEYDVVLSDAGGRVVYQWSAARVFPQVVHRIEIDGSWKATVEIPRPEAGLYSLQGWLTTASQIPMFSGTTPLVIE